MHYRQDSDGPVLSQERGSSVLSHSVQENWEKAVSKSPRGCCGFPWALPTRGEWSLVKREGGVPLETSLGCPCIMPLTLVFPVLELLAPHER